CGRGVMLGWWVRSTKSFAKNYSKTSNCLFLEHLRYSGEPQLSRHRMRSSYSFLCLSWSLLNLGLADLTQCAAWSGSQPDVNLRFQGAMDRAFGRDLHSFCALLRGSRSAPSDLDPYPVDQ